MQLDPSFAAWRVTHRAGLAAVLGLLAACQSLTVGHEGFDVEVTESTVYTTLPANNGAGPLWDFNATNIARIGDTVWVSGLNTVAGLPPLNNTECNLWKKTADAAWEQVVTLPGLTREPCPMGVLPGQRLIISTNATLNPPGKPGGGPAQPGLWEATPAAGFDAPAITQPGWRPAAGAFTEHSYRSLAVDGQRGEVFVMQNVGNNHAEWAFRDTLGTWSAQGRLDWPVKDINGRAMPLRVCYVVALVKDRAVHLLGVSDVVEPNEDWREFKRKLTGRSWDYVFRNLYYTWTPDVTSVPFRPWLEVASREATAGGVEPGDLWLDKSGFLHMVWGEVALDNRLRDRLFPNQKQRREINYGVIRDGVVLRKTTLLATQEGQPGPAAHAPRFHVTPDDRVFIFFYVNTMEGSSQKFSENRLAELKNNRMENMIRLPLSTPLNHYLISSGRFGNKSSIVLDVLGSAPGADEVVRHARLRINSRQPK